MRRFINIWENRERDGKYKVYLKTKEGVESFEYPWYFCLKFSDLTPSIKTEIKDMRAAHKIKKLVKQGKWLKVYVDYERKNNMIVKYFTSMIPTYEGDLKLWQRYLIDEDIELELDQKILYFDIETDDLKPGITPGEEQITSIAAIGSDGKEYQFFSIDDEKSILKKFARLSEKYDLLTGWNSEGFDLVALAKRCKMFRVEFGCWATEWSKNDMGGLDNVRKFGKYRARPETFNHIDMMMKIKEMHYRDTELIKKVRSFSLNAVAEAFLGEKKLERGPESTHWLARHKPKFFQRYNMQDVRLLVKLDQKLNVIQQKLIEHHVCNARINDYTSHGKIDPYALRAARLMGEHLPTRPEYKESDEYEDEERDDEDSQGGRRGRKVKADYTGGFVFDPTTGIHKDVHIFDFQSLYPSIIKTFNVSLDSFRGVHSVDIKKKRQDDPGYIYMPTGACFDRKKKGIIPSIIQNVLDERNKIRFEIMKKVKKDSPEYWNWHYRQYAFKVLANSMYGIMGASFSRYFKRELAEGITLTGQYLIKMMWKWMEDRGFTPIYGDSDSLFVKFNGQEVDIEELKKEVKAFIDNDLKRFHVTENAMILDYEKKFDKFILVAKKKYIGRAANGDMKVTGLEMKKRDTLPIAETLQREVLDLLLTKSKVRDEIIQIIRTLRKKVMTGKMTQNDLTYQKRLSREIDNYGKKMKDKNGDVKLKKDGTERTVPIPIWVQVATELKKKIDAGGKGMDKTMNHYSAGNYIPYIIISSDPKLKAIYASDFKGKYDKEYYWNAIFAPTQRILEVVYKKIDWSDIDHLQRRLL